MRQEKIFLTVILLVSLTFCETNVHAQSIPRASGPVMDCKASVQALALQGYNCYCSGGQLLCGGNDAGKSNKGGSPAAGMKAMIAGAVIESLLTSIFTPPSAPEKDVLAEQQKAAALAALYLAQKKARDAQEQAAYEKMMQSYKQLEGAADVDFKILSDTNLQFKTINGDMETLAADSRHPFDTPSEFKHLPEQLGGATPFFGDTMPTEDIQLLVNPENDPRVVDLRNAKTFIVDNLEKDSEKLATVSKETDGYSAIKSPDCMKLAQRLRGYIDQRNEFHKTVLLAQEQVTTWENANRNALVNAAKDGVEYFAGLYLDILKNRGLAADRLRRIYEKNASEMVLNVGDIKDIEAKIIRLKTMSSVGKFSDVANSANDWQTFVKDGMSSLINELTSSNHEFKEMLEDPRMQKYFTSDAPELNALLDISKIVASSNVLGKWVAKKMPVIAMLDISIKQTYNATDWYLSFKKIAETNKINGQVMRSAMSLQKHIDDTYSSLKPCR